MSLPTKDPDIGKKRGQWHEHKPFKWPAHKERIRKHIKSVVAEGKRNLYWCPTVLDGPRRRSENVLPTRCVWADLDDVDPNNLDLEPTHIWQSSPNRSQALWITDQTMQPRRASELSRAVAYSTGADPGGWDLSQVLRVPGSRNFKYKLHPIVRLVRSAGSTYDVADLADHFPDSQGPDKGRPELPPLPDTTPQRILRKYRDRLSPRIRELVNAKIEDVIIGERSDRLWELECRLIEVGLTTGEVVVLVRSTAWNKYRLRGDELERLWTEAEKASASTGVTVTGGGELTGADRAPKFVDYRSLLGSHLPPPSWLVDSFWVQGSHGIIAGEPKTYKSTLATDLCISVASGEPFLGGFDVNDPGPVVYVQEENSVWDVYDRIRKITHSKGLLEGRVKQSGRDIEITLPPELPMTFLNRYGFNFMEPEDRDYLEEHVQKVQPRLIMFDPLYLMLGSADENSAKELRPVLSWLLQLSNRYSCAVVIIHHWNKSGASSRGGQRMLGSTTLHGWIDSALYLSIPDGNGDADSEQSAGPSVQVEREFRSFPYQRSLSLSFTMAEPGRLGYEPQLSIVQDQFEELKIFLLAGRDQSATLRDIMDRFGMSRAKATRLTDSAFRKGMVTVEGGGRGKPKVITLT